MNEYLEDFQELQEQSTFKGQQWFGKRQQLVEKYGWAVPNDDVIEYCSAFDSLVGVGSGKAYWEYLISRAGCDVRATDGEPPDDSWMTVERAWVEDMNLTDDVVLTVWPPTHLQMSSQLVTQHRPSHVLYVGEQRGGCTATSQFFDTLERKYGLVARIELPSFAGVNDDFYHYVRKR